MLRPLFLYPLRQTFSFAPPKRGLMPILRSMLENATQAKTQRIEEKISATPEAGYCQRNNWKNLSIVPSHNESLRVVMSRYKVVTTHNVANTIDR